MSRRGYVVTTASDVGEAAAGARARTGIRRGRPEDARRIRAGADREADRPPDPNTRIVMLTGYASIATAVEAIKLGATHYLAKPVTPTKSSPR